MNDGSSPPRAPLGPLGPAPAGPFFLLLLRRSARCVLGQGDRIISLICGAFPSRSSMSTSQNDSRDDLLARAAKCAADGQLDEAERILNNALSIQPGDALIRYRLGSLYLRMENFSDAISTFHSALKLDPENPVILNELGFALDLSGDVNGAGDAYARAAACPKPFPPALYNHALRLMNSNASDTAEAVLEKALAAEPDYVPAMLALGEVFETRGEFETASVYYQRALSIEPFNADALLKTAYLEMSLCRFDSAAASFEAYLDGAGANVSALFSLGVCLQELGRTDDALDIYRRLLAEDPSHYYAVVKNLLSSGRGVIWLQASKLRNILRPQDA